MLHLVLNPCGIVCLVFKPRGLYNFPGTRRDCGTDIVESTLCPPDTHWLFRYTLCLTISGLTCFHQTHIVPPDTHCVQIPSPVTHAVSRHTWCPDTHCVRRTWCLHTYIVHPSMHCVSPATNCVSIHTHWASRLTLCLHTNIVSPDTHCVRHRVSLQTHNVSPATHCVSDTHWVSRVILRQHTHNVSRQTKCPLLHLVLNPCGMVCLVLTPRGLYNFPGTRRDCGSDIIESTLCPPDKHCIFRCTLCLTISGLTFFHQTHIVPPDTHCVQILSPVTHAVSRHTWCPDTHCV